MKRSETIKKSIIDSAELLFNQYGYNAISVDAICEKADVSKVTLYKYFGNKNRLVLEVLTQRDLFFKDSLNTAVSLFSEPKDKINAIIAWHIKWFKSGQYYGCMFIRAQKEFKEKEPTIAQLTKEHKLFILNLINKSLGKSSSDTNALAHIILLLIEGMIAYAEIFSIQDYNYQAEKKYIFQCIDQLH